MPRIVASVLWVLCVLTLRSAAASDDAHTPQPGTAERSQIIQAVRLAAAPELQKPVKFLVSRIRVQREWAFLTATPQQLDGRPFDYSATRYELMIKDGVFDDWLCALLRRQEGRWAVVALEIGATDVPYANWKELHDAPPEIFQ